MGKQNTHLFLGRGSYFPRLDVCAASWLGIGALEGGVGENGGVAESDSSLGLSPAMVVQLASFGIVPRECLSRITSESLLSLQFFGSPKLCKARGPTAGAQAS